MQPPVPDGSQPPSSPPAAAPILPPAGNPKAGMAVEEQHLQRVIDLFSRAVVMRKKVQKIFHNFYHLSLKSVTTVVHFYPYCYYFY